MMPEPCPKCGAAYDTVLSRMNLSMGGVQEMRFVCGSSWPMGDCCKFFHKDFQQSEYCRIGENQARLAACLSAEAERG